MANEDDETDCDGDLLAEADLVLLIDPRVLTLDEMLAVMVFVALLDSVAVTKGDIVVVIVSVAITVTNALVEALRLAGLLSDADAIADVVAFDALGYADTVPLSVGTSVGGIEGNGEGDSVPTLALAFAETLVDREAGAVRDAEDEMELTREGDVDTDAERLSDPDAMLLTDVHALAETDALCRGEAVELLTVDGEDSGDCDCVVTGLIELNRDTLAEDDMLIAEDDDVEEFADELALIAPVVDAQPVTLDVPQPLKLLEPVTLATADGDRVVQIESKPVVLCDRNPDVDTDLLVEMDGVLLLEARELLLLDALD